VDHLLTRNMQSYAELLRTKATIIAPDTRVVPVERVDVSQCSDRLPANDAQHGLIPAGAVIVAPRYDGMGKPLALAPRCWCCAEAWELDEIKEWHEKAYAFLKPGCGCLAARCCYRCFVCREHCRCAVTSGARMEALA
jgi:hypothetical protein